MIGVVLGTFAIVAVLIVVGLVIDRKVPLLPRASAPAAPPRRAEVPIPGATAATAVKVPRTWRPRLATGRCTCGKPLEVASDEPITLGGRPLIVVRLACAACGHARSLYLEPALA